MAPGVTVTPTSGLVTNENGGTASFTVVLNSDPTANVTIGLSSSNPSQGSISTSSLTFTPANWNIPQSVTVTGVDDHIDDGDIVYTIVAAPAVSSDPAYAGIIAHSVTVTNLNEDHAGFVVAPTSGLVTTTVGGTANFDVSLSSEPTADVTIGVSSSNSAVATVSTSELVFTPEDWNVAQMVVVTGQPGQTASDVTYTIVMAAAQSDDPKYSGLVAPFVSATNNLISPPAAPSDLAISPDTGASSTDGITDTGTLTLSGKLGSAGLSVELFDETLNVRLSDATVNGTAFTDGALARGGHPRHSRHCRECISATICP